MGDSSIGDTRASLFSEIPMSFGTRSIVIFSALASPSMGGVERFTNCLSNELASKGYRVFIITNNTHKIADFEAISDNVDIIRLPCFSMLNGRMPVPRIGKLFFELWKQISHINCSGVLINTRFYLHSILGLIYAKQFGICPVVLDHGSAYLTFGNPLFDLIEHFYEHAITMIGKRFPAKYYGISRKSLEWLNTFNITGKGIISNSIDAKRFRDQSSGKDYRFELQIDSDSLLVAFTGRLVPEKGIDSLLKAMRLLENRPIVLAVAGDGPLRKDIEACGMSNVRLLGRLSVPDIAALLISSDVLCLPSRSEGFSTSLLEASACGTSSITTDVGGARELIPDPSYGTILHSSDPNELACALLDSLRNKASLGNKGSKCKKLVDERFSWNNSALLTIEAMGLEE